MVTSTFAFPIEGLTVLSAWQVGPVRVVPVAGASEVVSAAAAVAPRELVKHFDGVRTLALVDSETFEEALDLVAAATGIPRVFQQAYAADTGHLPPAGFGLPGEVSRDSVTYAQNRARTGFGWRRLGGLVGFTLGDGAETHWAESRGFQFLAAALGRRILRKGRGER